MRPILPCLCVVLAACAGGGGSWPSLARRPIEGPAPGKAEAVAAPPVTAAPAPPVAIGDLPARLATLDRDLTDLATRFDVQRAATVAAAAKARGAKADSEPWSQAQLETTRLERIGSQAGDLRGRLDAVAGTLAAAASGGTDVAALLKTTGGLIARADALGQAFAAASAEASR